MIELLLGAGFAEAEVAESVSHPLNRYYLART